MSLGTLASGNTGGSDGRTRARVGVKAIQAWTSRLGKEASHGNMREKEATAREVKFLGKEEGSVRVTEKLIASLILGFGLV